MGKMIVKKADPLFIKVLANDYLLSNRATLEDLAERYKLGTKTVSNLLFRGIAENILSDRTADDIYEKIVYVHEKGRKQRALRWEKAFDERNEIQLREKKRSQRSKIEAEIMVLEFQLATWEDNFFGEAEMTSKEELQAQIKELKKKLA